MEFETTETSIKIISAFIMGTCWPWIIYFGIKAIKIKNKLSNRSVKS